MTNKQIIKAEIKRLESQMMKCQSLWVAAAIQDEINLLRAGAK